MTSRPRAKRARNKKDNVEEDHRLAKRVAHVVVDVDDYDNMITVLVGPEKKRFALHKDVACGNSEFFRVACSNNWREGQEKLVHLHELIDPSTFKAYSAWIYSGNLPDTTCAEDSDQVDKINKIHQPVELYLAAQVLDDMHLRNVTVHALFKFMQFHDVILSHNLVSRIWRNTVKGAKIRKMIVDVVVMRFSRAEFAELASRYSSEFMQEVAVAALAVIPTKSWAWAARPFSEYLEGE